MPDPDVVLTDISPGDSVPEFSFDRATAIRPRPEGFIHDVEIDGNWTIGGRPNGGYLLSLLSRAAVASADVVEGLAHPHALTASAHYLAAPRPGPAEVRAEVLRRGRRMSQVRSRLLQEGTARVEAVFTLGQLDPQAEPWWDDVPVPAGATPEARCLPPVTGEGPGGLELPIMQQVELRLDPAAGGLVAGELTGRAEMRGFLRFADDRPPDPLSLLLAVDILPPATIGLGTSGWVPTLEMTAYVRRVPAPGPLLVEHRARLVEADVVDEACDVWDSRGRLVAQATQLAGVRVGDARPPARR